MAIDETFKDHLRGILEELSDLKPAQQRYRTDVLINETDQISLIDFIKTYYSLEQVQPNDDLLFLENYLEPFDNLEVPIEQHPEILIPYGPAILAILGDEALVTEFSLAQNLNPGIRMLVAHFSNNPTILDHLSYDRCVMVRAEVAKNANTSEETTDRLKQDPFVHVRILAGGEVGDNQTGEANLISDIEINFCVCQETYANEGFEDFFGDQEGLEYPILTVEFEEEITEFGYWHWATQPFPNRWQDYLLNESVEYLKGPIPDQYSLNHAGHGANSYSINFRHVLGNIAIFAQSPYGGAYMNTHDQESNWDELQLRISRILLDHVHINVGLKNEIKIRKFLIVYSRFRIGDEPELWQNFEGEWKKIESISTWDDLVEYLKLHNK
jgi:hypothetical protein